VAVCGGVKYGELATALHREGWALHNLASLAHISVAGAVATGTHGSGWHNGSLATAVRSIDIVTAEGDIKTLRRGTDSAFDGSIVALGLCGVVTRLELDIEPTFEVSQVVYPDFSRSHYIQNFEEAMSSAYSVSYFTTWETTGKQGELWTKFKAPEVAPPSLLGVSASLVPRHPLPELDAGPCTEQLGVPGPWQDRLPHFRMGFTPSSGDELQTEFFVDAKDAVGALEALEPLAEEMNNLLWTSEIRIIEADDLWLSMCHQRQSVAIHFTWKAVPEVASIVPKIEKALAPYGARPHWGKIHNSSPQQLEESYQKLPEFRRLVTEMDPAGKFRNSEADALLGLVRPPVS